MKLLISLCYLCVDSQSGHGRCSDRCRPLWWFHNCRLVLPGLLQNFVILNHIGHLHQVEEGRLLLRHCVHSLTHMQKAVFQLSYWLIWLLISWKIYNPLSSCLDVDIFRSEWHYCKLQSSPPPFHCLLCKEDEAHRTSLPLCVFVVIFPNFLHNNVPQAILCAAIHWKRANLNANTKIRDLGWGHAAGGRWEGVGLKELRDGALRRTIPTVMWVVSYVKSRVLMKKSHVTPEWKIVSHKSIEKPEFPNS